MTYLPAALIETEKVKELTVCLSCCLDGFICPAGDSQDVGAIIALLIDGLRDVERFGEARAEDVTDDVANLEPGVLQRGGGPVRGAWQRPDKAVCPGLKDAKAFLHDVAEPSYPSISSASILVPIFSHEADTGGRVGHERIDAGSGERGQALGGGTVAEVKLPGRCAHGCGILARVTLALAAIVHDLAQVANIITLNAQVLDERVTDPELKEALADLQGAALRMPGLVERLRGL